MNNGVKLFFGDVHYPHGGYNDFYGYFSSIEEAKEYMEKNYSVEPSMWAHIVINDTIIVSGYFDCFCNEIWEWVGP